MSALERRVFARAHPRSRGENRTRRQPHGQHRGSSPLTRGKRPRSVRSTRRRRLIPAHAGKTRPPRTPSRAVEAHPRSRGENVYVDVVPSMRGGSSPLTRGKPMSWGESRIDAGLIPAHAGKTPRARTRRACPGGSSPLTRGKHQAPRPHRSLPGLIPAHAGKTPPPPRSQSCPPAHPRSRGENARAWSTGLRSSGSSPLTRGKPAAPTWGESFPGLIPAHAGKTGSARVRR